MPAYNYEENQIGPITAAQQPAPSVEPRTIPGPVVEKKPGKGKKAFGIVASIICLFVGLFCIAGEICGIGSFALIACLFGDVALPQELENIAYGLSGTGMIIGALFILDLIALILILVFSIVAIKKTDCPKGLSVISLVISIFAILLYVLLIIVIAVSIVVVVKSTGIGTYADMLFNGGAA